MLVVAVISSLPGVDLIAHQVDLEGDLMDKRLRLNVFQSLRLSLLLSHSLHNPDRGYGAQRTISRVWALGRSTTVNSEESE